jgi:23S rRNA pseudouridine2605 synthase
MFDSRNRTPRQGGYRQNENSREQRGASMSADGASFRPRFNPSNSAPQEGGRRRQRITRTTGAVRVEPTEARSFRPKFNPTGDQQGERSFRPRPKNNPSVYSNRKRQEYIKTYEDPTKPMRLNKYLANAGICSRREADDFIQAGVITVNGEVVDNL